jgi:hypothetical protein
MLRGKAEGFCLIMEWLRERARFAKFQFDPGYAAIGHILFSLCLLYLTRLEAELAR